jgi:hypothetical protein
MAKFIAVLSALLFIACSTKPIRSGKVAHLPKPKHQLTVPFDKSKNIYSIKKYARFMYDDSCTDLEFRINDLYKNELKYDPLSVLELTSLLEKQKIRRGCR